MTIKTMGDIILRPVIVTRKLLEIEPRYVLCLKSIVVCFFVFFKFKFDMFSGVQFPDEHIMIFCCIHVIVQLHMIRTQANISELQ